MSSRRTRVRKRTRRGTRKHARRGNNRFSQREISRAIRGLTQTGATLDHVEVDPVTGRLRVFAAKPGAARTNDHNEWDEDGEPSAEAR